jgi:phage terminase large subunit
MKFDSCPFDVSEVWEMNHNATEKTVVNQGGWRSTKTFSIIQELLIRSAKTPGGIRTIIGRDIPFLKSGPILDMLRIINSAKDFKHHIRFFNRSDWTLYFKNDSLIRFRSYEDPDDAKTTDQDDQYLIEANTIKHGWEIYRQVKGRTTGQVFICYNPTAPYWVHDNLIGKDNVKLIISDHRMNPFISQERHDEYEAITDKEFFKVYCRGLTGNISGTIYPNWLTYEGWPDDIDFNIWAIDYAYGESKAAGYTAIIRIGVKEPRSMYLKEVCYIQGAMDEHSIKDVLIGAGWVNGDMFYSEHDPEMISALRRNDVSVWMARKGERSELHGITKVRQFQCYYNPADENLNRERIRYRFLQVGDIVTNTVEDTKQFHLMACLRYGIYTHFFGQ